MVGSGKQSQTCFYLLKIDAIEMLSLSPALEYEILHYIQSGGTRNNQCCSCSPPWTVICFQLIDQLRYFLLRFFSFFQTQKHMEMNNSHDQCVQSLMIPDYLCKVKRTMQKKKVISITKHNSV